MKKLKILVIGLPKSGTTILTYRIAKPLKKYRVVFEPKGGQGLVDIDFHKKITSKHSRHLVVKCFFNPNQTQNLESITSLYDKVVFIYRDPRDWIVSTYFYRWKDIEKHFTDKNLEKLKEKEDSPLDIPFKSLINKNAPDRMMNKYQKLIDLKSEYSRKWCFLKYEDFVSQNDKQLEDYLGFTIDHQVEVPGNLKRVARTKSHSSWRIWFNEEDVRFFKNLCNPILERLGYNSSDWKIKNSRNIDSTFGSEYVEYLKEEKNKAGSIFHRVVSYFFD